MKARQIYQSLHLGGRLPALGIVAFSLCSVNSVANLFLGRASNPTPALWLAAGLVELTTAWLVHQVVENVRRVTKSGISQQDKRFYTIILRTFVALSIPSLALSVFANAQEFGSIPLGFTFPILSMACAVGSALPQAARKLETEKLKDRAESNRHKERMAEIELKAKQMDFDREQREAREASEKHQRESEREQRESEKHQMIDNLSSNARQILISLSSDGPQSQSELAQRLSVTPQTVSYHIKRLAGLGLVGSNGQGIEALVDVGGNGATGHD